MYIFFIFFFFLNSLIPSCWVQTRRGSSCSRTSQGAQREGGEKGTRCLHIHQNTTVRSLRPGAGLPAGLGFAEEPRGENRTGHLHITLLFHNSSLRQIPSDHTPVHISRIEKKNHLRCTAHRRYRHGSQTLSVFPVRFTFCIKKLRCCIHKVPSPLSRHPAPLA